MGSGVTVIHPYRSNDLVNAPPPNSFVALVWRWILLRRADRIEAEERKATLQLAARPKRVSIHMVRLSTSYPFMPERVAVEECPGKSAPRPSGVSMINAYDYWLCSTEHCCCEVFE